MTRDKVQTLRGIACLALLAFHVVGATAEQGLKLNSGVARALTDIMVAIRMPLFAYIAGTMHVHSRQQGWTLVQKKFHRLIIPMLIVGTLFGLVQTLTPDSNKPVQDLYLMHIVPVAHYWFLESLFLVFCVMALIERRGAISSGGVWLLLFALSALAYLMNPGFIWFGVRGAVYLFPFFLLGYAVNRFDWMPTYYRRGWARLFLGVGTFVIALSFYWGEQEERFTWPLLVAGLLMASGLQMLALKSRVLAYIGDHGFVIYLFHSFFTAASRMVLLHLGQTNLRLLFAVGMACGLAGPIVLEKLIRLVPALNYWILGVSEERSAVHEPK